MCEFTPCFIMTQVRQRIAQQNLLGLKANLSPVQDNLKLLLSSGSIAFSLWIFVLCSETQDSVIGKVKFLIF